MSLKVLYLCDPEKNAGCKKTCCKHNPNADWPVCDSSSNVENAIVALEEGKDFDQWYYEEVPRLNASPFNSGWAVLTEGSIITLEDIWEMAVYVVYTYRETLKEE